MIKWNEEHPELEFTKETPGQSDFIACQNDSTPLQEVEEATAFIRQKAGVEGIDKLFDEQGIDLVVAPGDSALCIYSSYAGYPVGTAPVPSYIHPNGRPFGIQVIARPGQEALILRFMAALEDKIGGHPLPKALMSFGTHEENLTEPEQQMIL
jgi:amidase